ncbi:hypothetical protein A2U01_0103600 [Trifolium medium]|uniref:Uncharacterized protein n=1 Tax=Trifolium medium TaxID=97028 RepID=A0A392V241_9FABA|nr:hypothetical protein [Trifolium medium]
MREAQSAPNDWLKLLLAARGACKLGAGYARERLGARL